MVSSTETENAIIVYTAEAFLKAFKQFGNQRGLWIVWADKGASF